MALRYKDRSKDMKVDRLSRRGKLILAVLGIAVVIIAIAILIASINSGKEKKKVEELRLTCNEIISICTLIAAEDAMQVKVVEDLTKTINKAKSLDALMNSTQALLVSMSGYVEQDEALSKRWSGELVGAMNELNYTYREVSNK